MKKNALLTFIFACIPGAGQMYYGYMQRGLSLITLFCASFMLGALAGPLVVTMFIVWMFSFFDTYDLIRHLAAGDPKPDSLLLLGDWEDLKRMVPKHNRLLGWGLIALGIWALYDMLLEPLLYNLLEPRCGLFGDQSHPHHGHCGGAHCRRHLAAGAAPQAQRRQRCAALPRQRRPAVNCKFPLS